MIARLGDFLRMTLERSGEQMSTVRDEVEVIRAPVGIEKVRFQDSIATDIRPGALDAVIPAFVWQPAFENAIHHGIATSEHNGRIYVRARVTGGRFSMEIRDNGGGLASGSDGGMQEGIGLSTTRAVLQEVYGSAFSFSVANVAGGEVAASFRIPFTQCGFPTRRLMESAENGSLKVMVVDDEPLGRKRVTMMLQGAPDVELLGEFAGGPETVDAVRTLQPDLLFLDIQMPGMDGFELLREIGTEHLPFVIFVTAYDEHAVEAFQVHAIDYLLKPFDQERFLESLARAREQIEVRRKEDVQLHLSTFLKTPRSAPRLERILVKSAGRISFLKANEVDWIEAQGDYVRLHTSGKKHLIREKISELEQQLSAEQFIRIHRSTIVNIDRIKEMQPLFYGEYSVILQDGTRLTLSRSYRDRVFQRLTASS